MMKIRFLGKYDHYNVGDVGVIERTLALRLVGLGLAEFVVNEKKPPVKPKAKAVEPETKKPDPEVKEKTELKTTVKAKKKAVKKPVKTKIEKAISVE